MRNVFQHLVILAARVLLSIVFLVGGISHLLHWSGTIETMRSAGMVLPQLFLPAALVLLLVGGMSVLVGYHARLGALLLIVFLIPATLIFHAFWNLSSPPEVQQQMINFLKNVGLLGGLLMILGFGSGGFSLELVRRRPDKES